MSFSELKRYGDETALSLAREKSRLAGEMDPSSCLGRITSGEL